MSIMKSHLEGINLNQQNSQIMTSGDYKQYWGYGGLQQNYMYTATIRKVSNGYVLTVGSAEYVFESTANMVTKLKEVLEQPNNGK